MFTETVEKFIYNSSIGIHVVSPEGIIIYANECELDVLGYTKNEYIGHHVSEFQIDKECLSMMLERLNLFEKLKNYPARVQGKVGIKYIIYNSSVFKEGGQFKHTRCYGTEVEKVIYDVFMKYFQPE
jgi:PAS domain S-box-containing protein